MTSEFQADGIILLCDLEGIVQQVEQDELGLTDNHSIGRPFTVLVHGDSLKTAFGFLEVVQGGEPAFGYGLYLRSGDDKLLLHINGYALDKQIIITGARSRVIGSQLYHRTLQSHHAQVNAVYAALAAERSSHAARERELLDQAARLQADASALSAELAQEYAARASDPDEARDQAQHVVELTVANGRLQAELAQWAAAAESRRETESRFESIFRAGPVGMAVSARSDGRLLHVNEQLERMLDYKPGELTGQPLHKLLAPGSRSVLGKVEAHLSVPHSPLEIATKFRMKDGSSRDLLAAFELAEVQGELFLVTAVLEAQEHVQSEQVVQENEQLRRELSVQNTALRQEVKLLQEDMRAFKVREQSLVDQAVALREKIRNLETDIALREQRERMLSSNIAAYQPDARERTLNSQIGTLQEAKQELSAQVAALQEQMAKSEAVIAEQKERELTLVNQVSAVQRLNYRIEALHGAMEESLKRQLAELQQQQAALEAELSRRRQSEDELSHLAAHLLESSAGHETDLAGFRQREATLVGELTEMRAEALLQEQELKAQLDSLKAQSAKLEEEQTRQQAAPQAAAASQLHAEATPGAASAQRAESAAPTPTLIPAETNLQVTQIAALRRQVGQLKAELNRRELAQQSQLAMAQERADLLDRQIRERREAERALLSRIKEWRERAQPAGAGRSMERERALLEQIDRLEQHIKASVEASLQIGSAAAALRAAQLSTQSIPPSAPAPTASDAAAAQTEQELRKELGALHRQEQERIRQLAGLQAQLGIRELELHEHLTAANLSAQPSEVVIPAPLAVPPPVSQAADSAVTPAQPPAAEGVAIPTAEAPTPDERTAHAADGSPLAEHAVETQDFASPTAVPMTFPSMLQAYVIIPSVASSEPIETMLPSVASSQPAASIVRAAVSSEPPASVLSSVPASEPAANFAPEPVETVPAVSGRAASTMAEAVPSVPVPDIDLAAQNAIANLARDTTDLPTTLTLLAAEFGHQMHAQGSFLLLWNEDRQLLAPGSGYGLYAGPDAALPFAQSELNILEPSLTTGHALSAPVAGPGGAAAAGEGNYSTLSLPLSAGGARLGVALITFDQTHHFTPDEIERGEKFAQQVATAIAHTQRQLGTLQQIEALTAAQRAGRRLQPLHTRAALETEVRAVLAEAFHYTYAEVLLMETGTAELSPLLAEPRNQKTGLMNKLAELTRRDIRTQAIRTGLPVRLVEVRDGPLRENAVLCVPLLFDGQVSGVVYLECPKTNPFSALDQQALEMIAGSVAGAVENVRAFHLIEQQHQQVRALAMQLAGGEDTARRQMARQLQLDVGQSLMMLSIQLDSLPAEGAAGVSNIKAKVAGAQQQVDDITRNVRDVVAELHPPALDELGLPGALRYYGGRFSERTGVPAIVNSENWKRRSPGIEAVLFRIVQETLTRVDRGDTIKPIRITLDHSGATASLSIAGAGVGASASSDQDLMRLQERAAAIGGEVRVETEAGQESRLIVELASADAAA